MTKLSARVVGVGTAVALLVAAAVTVAVMAPRSGNTAQPSGSTTPAPTATASTPATTTSATTAPTTSTTYPVTPDGGGLATLATGALHSCQIRADGTLWCWGRNRNGQLGVDTNLGNTRANPTPEQVIADGADQTWLSVEAGYRHTCGIRSDHTVWCWGSSSGGFPDPVQVIAEGTDQTWLSVSAGSSHTCGIRSDNTLWCWGDNSRGQLGQSDEVIIGQVIVEGTDQSWISVSAGAYHTCGIRADNTLWCWGDNTYGQVGDPSTYLGAEKRSHDSRPVQVVGGSTPQTWLAVSAGGSYTCGIRSDKSLWCWGSNYSGELGDPSVKGVSVTPVQVAAGTTDQSWLSVSAGGAHTCGVLADESLWCWGMNDEGQMGSLVDLGDDNGVPTPNQVSDSAAVQTWLTVHAGGSHTCGLRTDETLWCWGDNLSGQLGSTVNSGKDDPNPTPAEVIFPGQTTATPSPSPSPTPVIHPCASAAASAVASPVSTEPVLTDSSVVTVRQLSDGSRSLVAYDLATGQTQQLVPLKRDDFPTVNAVGSAVVVVRYTGKADPWSTAWGTQSGTGSHLALIDLATGERRPLTNTKAGVFVGQPTWNRTGDGWVYFLRSGPNFHGALCRVDPSTGEVQQVPRTQAHSTGVSQFLIEPGGQTAWVYVGWPCKTEPCSEGWRLDLSTGRATELPFWTAAVPLRLALAPFGNRVASTSNYGGVPCTAVLSVARWSDEGPVSGTYRTVLEVRPSLGETDRWTIFGQVGWLPGGKVIAVQANRLSWNMSKADEPTLVAQRIRLVTIADGSSVPLGPTSVRDQSFDVWTAPATGDSS